MQTTETKNCKITNILPSTKERLLILEQIRGMWKHRRPDPIKELKKIRAEWERKLPPIK